MTSGTVTDAWPVARGETWSSDYGELGLPGIRLGPDLTGRSDESIICILHGAILPSVP